MSHSIAVGWRLRNFTVAVSNHPWSDSPGFLAPGYYAVCLHHEGSVAEGGVLTVDCKHLHISPTRYVYIVKGDADTEPFTLCEVQVFDNAQCEFNF